MRHASHRQGRRRHGEMTGPGQPEDSRAVRGGEAAAALDVLEELRRRLRSPARQGAAEAVGRRRLAGVHSAPPATPAARRRQRIGQPRKGGPRPRLSVQRRKRSSPSSSASTWQKRAKRADAPRSDALIASGRRHSGLTRWRAGRPAGAACGTPRRSKQAGRRVGNAPCCGVRRSGGASPRSLAGAWWSRGTPCAQRRVSARRTP